MIQFDDLLFGARLPRCDFDLVEELPLHGIVSTQPVGLAVPDLSRRLAGSISRKEQGQRDYLPCSKTGNLIGRPHEGEAIRVLSLRPLEVRGSIHSQQGGNRVIRQAV